MSMKKTRNLTQLPSDAKRVVSNRLHSNDALLSVADLGVITPLRDGMNTTSMEFVIAQEKTKKSPLVLSEFMGISNNMSEALQINPWNLGVRLLVADIYLTCFGWWLTNAFFCFLFWFRLLIFRFLSLLSSPFSPYPPRPIPYTLLPHPLDRSFTIPITHQKKPINPITKTPINPINEFQKK